MNFIFSCSTGYRVESSWTREDKFISTSGHVIFCLLYKHINDVFDDFPKISDSSPKIFQNCSKGLTNVFEHFSNIFRRFPKVVEAFRGGTDDVSIIQHHLWVLFKRFSGYRNGNRKTCDNNLKFSLVKIYMLFAGREVRIGRNCARGLEYGPRPQAEGCTQDLGHSFSQYGLLHFLLDIWKPPGGGGRLSIWKGMECSWEILNLIPMRDLCGRCLSFIIPLKDAT